MFKSLAPSHYILIALLCATWYYHAQSTKCGDAAELAVVQGQVLSATSDDAGHQVKVSYAAKRIEGHGPEVMNK
jgi:hypothetical protein